MYHLSGQDKKKDQEYLETEYATVRTELRELKSCQLTYLTVSITATALILSLLGKISAPSDGSGYDSMLLVIALIAPLAPLAILIPAGIIFFDKSITISRAIGYCRVIEWLWLERINGIRIVGFENALSLWRDYPFVDKKKFLLNKIETKHNLAKSRFKIMNPEGANESSLDLQPESATQTAVMTEPGKDGSGIQSKSPTASISDPGKSTDVIQEKESIDIRENRKDVPMYTGAQQLDMICLKTPLRYWMIVLDIFIGLSIVCTISSMLIFLSLKPHMAQYPWWIIFTSLIVCFLLIPGIVIFYSLVLFRVVSNLTFGKFSYDYNEQVWLDILRADIPESPEKSANSPNG
jgi:hypothetical protein